jgi:hypothetical protein
MMKHKQTYLFGLLALCITVLAAPGGKDRQMTAWADPYAGRMAAPDDTTIMDDADSIFLEDNIMRDPNGNPIDPRILEEVPGNKRNPMYEGDADTVAPPDKPYSIFLITRAYKDRVALRWAPSEYVPFRLLRDAGYLVTRHWVRGNEAGIDTLKLVKPFTEDEFKKRFEPSDTLAGVAVQLLYGQQMTLDQTEAAPGSIKGLIEVYEQQQEIAGFAMFIAERRPDLAEAMGLAYTDRNVKAGTDYVYVVQPNLPDSVLDCAWANDMVSVGKDFEQQPLDCIITDTVAPPTQIMIYWNQLPYSAYDIERREVVNGKPGKWTKLNNKPFVTLINNLMDDDTDNMFHDNPGKPGTYEYRIYGYDSFGDRTLPSKEHRVELPDLVPPIPPEIDYFHLLYITDDSIHATIYFHNDSITDDLVGYRVMYKNDLQDTTAVWRELNNDIIAPNAKKYTCNVTGLSAGHIMLIAFDKAGNRSKSMEQLLNINDFIPPSAPTNVRANVAPDGYVVLRWTPSPEPDVHYYEVYSANDTREVFHNQTSPEQVDTFFVDSLAQGLNQRYIYYKVKAVDWAGNTSDFSSTVQVLRPNYIPPSVCRADSVWMTDDDINMWWIQSNEADLAYHRLFRRLEGEETWTLMGVFNADSLSYGDNIIRFTDRPKYNMKKRYIYAVETYNLTGVTSGLSQFQTFLFRGPRIVDIKVTLSGGHTGKNNEAKLAWETGRVPDYGEWHYSVYRKGPDDKDFKFVMATKPDEPVFNDFLTRPGETAQYYVCVQYDEGRRSQPSNIVTVSAPKEQEQR